MKKFLLIALALVAFVGIAQAEMDQAVLTSSSITTNVGTGTGVVKGEIYSIRLDGAATKTNAVVITTAEGETLLSVAALTADATYYPRVPLNLASDGTAIALFDGGDTNALYGPIGVSSDLTMTVTPAAATTGTNVTKAIITFKK